MFLLTCTNAYCLDVGMALINRDEFFAESHTYNNYCDVLVAHMFVDLGERVTLGRLCLKKSVCLEICPLLDDSLF